MERRSFKISLTRNPSIAVRVIPGHFTTSHSHLNYYLDLCDLKTNARIAKEVAVELITPYLAATPIDTIVCIEGTEVIGAYMADELRKSGTSVINSGKDIHVVTPLNNIHRKLMFQDNVKEMVFNQNVLLLISSISTGITVNGILELLSYYGGRLAWISALFNAYPEKLTQKIHSLFTSEDIPGYKLFDPKDCEMCKEGRKLDAIVFHDGYTKI
ncbi:MAG: hypothetical protein ACOX3Q_00990 [Clostridia bacterium]|jgi:adenine/guanine phosphoribosyltransferase-like PRPP-binding protein